MYVSFLEPSETPASLYGKKKVSLQTMKLKPQFTRRIDCHLRIALKRRFSDPLYSRFDVKPFDQVQRRLGQIIRQTFGFRWANR